MEQQITQETGDEVVDLIIDTHKKSKQAIVFVNSRRSAEACSDRVAKALKIKRNKKLDNLADEILKALSSPTKQCKRLAKNVRRGAAFHHSGLNYKQRGIVEDGFKSGLIKCVCATPSLAVGVDMPAFRVVIRDLKRFAGNWGMQYIPVLEYEQQIGRAGRPSYDTEGQGIVVCKNEGEFEEILEKYLRGDPEDILSKLSSEPVLRTYVLSLIASRFVSNKNELMNFMKDTFYAHQYGNISDLEFQIDNVTEKLKEWEFVRGNKKNKESNNDFVSASNLEKNNQESLKATKLGKRISELYLDPYTANYLLECMKKTNNKGATPFALLHMICNTLEMRPLFRVRKSEYQSIEKKLIETHGTLLASEPNRFSGEYDDFLNSVKTSIVLEHWINESKEEYLMDEYGVRPGPLYGKIERGDWLLYSCLEMANLQGFRSLTQELQKLRTRLKNGVKAELLPLLRLKNIGRVRSRKLFRNGIKDLGGVKRADVTTLAELLGKKTALSVKKQVGQNLSPEDVKVKKNKRKGQISLEDF